MTPSAPSDMTLTIPTCRPPNSQTALARSEPTDVVAQNAGNDGNPTLTRTEFVTSKPAGQNAGIAPITDATRRGDTYTPIVTLTNNPVSDVSWRTCPSCRAAAQELDRYLAYLHRQHHEAPCGAQARRG